MTLHHNVSYFVILLCLTPDDFTRQAQFENKHKFIKSPFILLYFSLILIQHTARKRIQSIDMYTNRLNLFTKSLVAKATTALVGPTCAPVILEVYVLPVFHIFTQPITVGIEISI